MLSGKLLSSSKVDAEFLSKLIQGKIVLSIETDLAIKHYLKKVDKVNEANEILANANIVIFFNEKRFYVAFCSDNEWYLREYELSSKALEVFVYSKPRGGDILKLKDLLGVT